MLNKYIGDSSLIEPTKNIWIKDSSSYEDIAVHILDHKVFKFSK